MSKRNLGIIIILFGLVLLLKKLPLPIDFALIQDLLPYIALAGFGVYLLSRKNYQFGLPLIYIGAAYALDLGGWINYVNKEYFLPSVFIVVGIGFIVQGQLGRR